MDEVDIHPMPPICLGRFAEIGKDPVFHALAQDAATQQKRVDVERLGRELVQDHSDQAILPKPVAHADGQNFEAFVAAQSNNFVLGAASGGEIELIGSLSQLRNAGELFRGGWFNPDLQV